MEIKNLIHTNSCESKPSLLDILPVNSFSPSGKDKQVTKFYNKVKQFSPTLVQEVNLNCNHTYQKSNAHGSAFMHLSKKRSFDQVLLAPFLNTFQSLKKWMQNKIQKFKLEKDKNILLNK